MARVRYGSRVQSERWLWPLIAVVVVLIACGTLAFIHITQSNKAAIPEAIQNQLPFSPLVLGQQGSYEGSGYKFDTTSQALSFKADSKSTDVVISEQTLPPQFTEVQGYQDQFLSTVIQQTSTVNTANGVIYLGHPNKDPSKQVGVLIGQGLLVFISPQNGTLAAPEWRKLGDQLQIEKGF